MAFQVKQKDCSVPNFSVSIFLHVIRTGDLGLLVFIWLSTSQQCMSTVIKILCLFKVFTYSIALWLNYNYMCSATFQSVKFCIKLCKTLMVWRNGSRNFSRIILLLLMTAWVIVIYATFLFYEGVFDHRLQ